MMPVMRNQNWLPSLFNDFFGDEWLVNRANQLASPAVNIIENENDYRIEVAAPGMTKEDVKVNVNDRDELVISLEKRVENEDKDHKDEKHAKKGTYLRREFSYSSFRQSFALPDNVEKSKIEAKMEHGVLTIDLPKKEETKQVPTARCIEIK